MGWGRGNRLGVVGVSGWEDGVRGGWVARARSVGEFI